MKQIGMVLTCAFLFCFLLSNALFPQEKALNKKRKKAAKLLKKDNRKKAYELAKKVVLNPNDPKPHRSLEIACSAADYLDDDEIDWKQFIKRAAETHPENWRLRKELAKCLLEVHIGLYEYNRAVALQQIEKARQLLPRISDTAQSKTDRVKFYRLYEEVLLEERGNLYSGGVSWDDPRLLQIKTDLSATPDPSLNKYLKYSSCVPVDRNGNPLSYSVPDSFGEAKNDGERWRWILKKITSLKPELEEEMRYRWAQFCQERFGVQKLEDHENYRLNQDGRLTTNFDLDRLKNLDDDETIARLATGWEKITFPRGHNHISLYKKIVKKNDGKWARKSLWHLTNLYDRRQNFKKAETYLRELIERFGKTNNRLKALEKITGSRGEFQSRLRRQFPGRNVRLKYRYRNGTSVDFQLERVDMDDVAERIKSYVKSNPNPFEEDNVNLGDLADLLDQYRRRRYLVNTVKAWNRKLEPANRQKGKTIQVKTKIKKPGVYLLTARMKGGNTSRIVIWANRTGIVHRPMEGKHRFYLLDFITGKPVENANITFFGYNQEKIKDDDITRKVLLDVKTMAKTTGENGGITISDENLDDSHSWMITMDTGSRFTIMEFSEFESGTIHPFGTRIPKYFLQTDRSLYRPGQTVHYSLWVRSPGYYHGNNGVPAGKQVKLMLREASGSDFKYETTKKLDQNGHVSGKIKLDSEIETGLYNLFVVPEWNKDKYRGHRGWYDYVSFRVEEFRKPRFEVNVNTPKEPVKPDQQVHARVKARYFFGKPVPDGTVRYEIVKTSPTSEDTFPAEWTWLYGAGYDRLTSLPPWKKEKKQRPSNRRRYRQNYFHQSRFYDPDLVTSGEMDLEQDGTVKIPLTEPEQSDKRVRYHVRVTVRTGSRRTAKGSGYVWYSPTKVTATGRVKQGFYHPGNTVRARFHLQTPNQKPLTADGTFLVYRHRYPESGKRKKEKVFKNSLSTSEKGFARATYQAEKQGQYSLVYRYRTETGVSGSCRLFVNVIGEENNPQKFQFSDLELIPKQRHYTPGDTLKLLVASKHKNARIHLFPRPEDGLYREPDVFNLKGHKRVIEIPIKKQDRPNFFLEAFAIADGEYLTARRMIPIPPTGKRLDVSVDTDKTSYKPGETVDITTRVKSENGKPVKDAQVVTTVYDRSLDSITTRAFQRNIFKTFWGTTRRYHPAGKNNMYRLFYKNYPEGADFFYEIGRLDIELLQKDRERLGKRGGAKEAAMGAGGGFGGGTSSTPSVEVRKNFRDSVFWSTSLRTNESGVASTEVTLPDNLTSWKIRTWVVQDRTRAGQGEGAFQVRRPLVLQPATPRFFVEGDRPTLSAMVINNTDTARTAEVFLKPDENRLKLRSKKIQTVKIPGNDQVRVNWKTTILNSGTLNLKMGVRSGEHSDGIKKSIRIIEHGILKQKAMTGIVSPDQTSASRTFTVPEKHKEKSTRLELRVSPTLAGAMLDAIPYLINFPYDCVEQTMNRFLPTVLTARVLKNENIDLQSIKKHRTNLNPAELGDPEKRKAQWKMYDRNPVYNPNLLDKIIDKYVARLEKYQLGDGGWKWFPDRGGYRMDPYMTAIVLRGLLVANSIEVELPDGMIKKAVEEMGEHVEKRIDKLTGDDEKPDHPRNLDALVFLVMTRAENQDFTVDNSVKKLQKQLVKNRKHLSPYGKALLALGFHEKGKEKVRDGLIQHLEQYLRRDRENKTAYLDVPDRWSRYSWYGNEVETSAIYLKLLSTTQPNAEISPRIVKYLLTNRKHATDWGSTRTTALVLEAFTHYLRATDELSPKMTVSVFVDGEKRKSVEITTDNLFSYDARLTLDHTDLDAGKHTVKIRREGKGRVYFNGYLRYFSKRKRLRKAGLNVRVRRNIYVRRHTRKKYRFFNDRGMVEMRPVKETVWKKLKNRDHVQSGDFLRVELIVKAKNRFSYLLIKDPKPAGTDPIQNLSGYLDHDSYHSDGYNNSTPYMKPLTNHVAFFMQTLSRGTHRITYRTRAESPGTYSALPAVIKGMYAPELRGNSNEFDLNVDEEK